MKESAIPNEQLTDLARWFKVLGEPNRLLLLEKIIEGVQCNCELGTALQMAPNLISHHLAVLREAGLVNVDRDPIDARWVYYSVNPLVMEQLGLLFSEFLDPDRIQPRQLSCGPQTTEEQRLSFLRMTS
ncbi:MAG: metalloregulator ArsR/SmtB family transcription factor [Anaerolineaceae bacterium]